MNGKASEEAGLPSFPLRRPAMVFRRWLTFNTVGAFGIVVQFTVLLVLTGWLGLNYLIGTLLAVEAAVLNNFIWHERWTWADCTSNDRGGMLRRLWRFHLANGLFSLVGNLLLMRVLVGMLGMHYAVANALAIAACSTLNFIASDRFVFKQGA